MTLAGTTGLFLGFFLQQVSPAGLLVEDMTTGGRTEACSASKRPSWEPVTITTTAFWCPCRFIAPVQRKGKTAQFWGKSYEITLRMMGVQEEGSTQSHCRNQEFSQAVFLPKSQIQKRQAPWGYSQLLQNEGQLNTAGYGNLKNALSQKVNTAVRFFHHTPIFGALLLCLILDLALCKENFLEGMGCGKLLPFSWKDDQVWNQDVCTVNYYCKLVFSSCKVFLFFFM